MHCGDVLHKFGVIFLKIRGFVLNFGFWAANCINLAKKMVAVGSPSDYYNEFDFSRRLPKTKLKV